MPEPDEEMPAISGEDFSVLNRLIGRLLDVAWDMQRHIEKEHMDECEYSWGDDMAQINNRINEFMERIKANQ